jgi:hypothetical protein
VVQVEILRAKFPQLDIEVDGGLSPKTIDAAAKVVLSFIQEKLNDFLVRIDFPFSVHTLRAQHSLLSSITGSA